jgi:hypothetical protein
MKGDGYCTLGGCGVVFFLPAIFPFLPSSISISYLGIFPTALHFCNTWLHIYSLPSFLPFNFFSGLHFSCSFPNLLVFIFSFPSFATLARMIFLLLHVDGLADFPDSL